MSHTAPSPAPAPDPALAAEAERDLDVLRAERRLMALEELREIGMELVRALRDRVVAGADEVADDPAAAAGDGPPKDRDPADAFSRLSRAIRLTLVLEASADEALRDLKAGLRKAREEKRARAAEEVRAAAVEARDRRKLRIEALVGMAAERQITDAAMLDRLEMDVGERLADSEAFWIDPARPLRDIVDHLCKCFGLTPDWSRWDGEAWIEEDQPPWPWGPSPLAIDKSDPFMPITRYADITFADYTDPTFQVDPLE